MRRLTLGLSLALCACGDGAAETNESPEWRLAVQGLPAALISVAGTSTNDIWFAGADLGDGSGPLILHYDGSALTRHELELQSDAGVDLWWVQALGPDNVYFGGTQGTIIRFDGSTFSKLGTPGTDTVFGIWGTEPDDLWAVGGDPSLEGRAFVWRTNETLDFDPASGLPDLGISAYFKVWGRAANDLVIVGANGTILRADANRLCSVDSPTSYNLTTVHVAETGPYLAVGGFGDGVILEDDGSGWRDATPSPPPRRLFGVWSSGERGVAVGSNGSLLERDARGWREVPNDLRVTLDLHAAFIDEEGGAWAVGGDLVSTPKVDGLILYKGSRQLPNAVEPEP